MPFILLPFRPSSDPSAARTFIRNFFDPQKGVQLRGNDLIQELMLTEPTVSGDIFIRRARLRLTGPGQCHEVVLEPPRWRCGHMGGL